MDLRAVRRLEKNTIKIYYIKLSKNRGEMRKGKTRKKRKRGKNLELTF